VSLPYVQGGVASLSGWSWCGLERGFGRALGKDWELSDFAATHSAVQCVNNVNERRLGFSKTTKQCVCVRVCTCVYVCVRVCTCVCPCVYVRMRALVFVRL
jgi:hypothetical protein